MDSIKVYVKLLCVDVPPDKSRGAVSLPDASTVEKALEVYSAIYGIDIPLSEFNKSMFLINKSPAKSGSVLHNSDVLTVMRILAGG